MTYCVLTCNGDTTDAELVTYRWTSGDITWSSTKEHKITKEDDELWFSCAFENPVSFISSEIVFNPFMEKGPLYGKIGDKAVLTSDSVVNPINSIVWKHGPDIAMEWYGDETYSYRQFKDHGRLNTLTGALTITGLTSDDSGNYTVDINNKLTSKTELLVISPVSKPTLSEWCSVTYCVFTCNGDTTGAEPVTYWWTSGDMTWSSTKEHKITMVEKELWSNWFSCVFENPVSINSSEKVFNPFIRNQLIFMAILLLVVCIIIITFRHKGIINFSCKWINGVLTWMFIFIAVSLFIQVVCVVIIIIYLEYKGRKEDLTWMIILIAVFGVILVGCIIIIIYLIYKGRKGVLMWIFIFIAVVIPAGCIITIIYLIYKGGNKDLARMLILTAVVGVILVGFIIFIIYLIYKGIIFYFRRKRRAQMSEMLPPVQETSTQDPTSVGTQDPSNETEKSPMIPDNAETRC
ncbi:uncharacterized protein [Thunnus thynnus]|uniref:uncharacterized protein n=1 Tax=Thunnus thynnus TaxID=8237 RepID=UPI0035287BB7